eukprot:jgi/Galph1/4341/GphlegSOOS_G3026.1
MAYLNVMTSGPKSTFQTFYACCSSINIHSCAAEPRKYQTCTFVNNPLLKTKTQYCPKKGSLWTCYYRRPSRRNPLSLKPSPKTRLLSFLPYLMPLLDGVMYGRFVFAKQPLITALVFNPLQPLLIIYRGIPFLAFLLFAMLFYFVVRNEQVDTFIRFNTMQAILIDLVLIIPQMFLHATSASGAIPSSVVEGMCTLVFYSIMVITGYVILCLFRGSKPDQVPLISEASEAQLRRQF